ncbi:HNH endonuclease, partial [Mycobacterium sp. ITM-2017-0098]
GTGSDAHYAELAKYATVRQLRTAIRLEPRTEPDPPPRPEPERPITKTGDDKYTYWRIKLPHEEAAKVDAALNAHRDALVADWKH